MFHFKISILKGDGYYIKPDIHVNAPESYVGIGRIYYAPYLASVNKILRITIIRTGSGLDLNKNQDVVFGYYQIQFLVAASPVPVQDDITVLFKISGGDILALMP